MPSTTALKLGAFAAIALVLAGCEEDHVVTSVNPIFQSAESNELRRQISGATLQFNVESCVTTIEYARNGARRQSSRCEQPGAEPSVRTMVGTWIIRDEQLCWNTQVRDGVRLSYEEQTNELCARVTFDGNAGALHTGRTRLPFRVIARA